MKITRPLWKAFSSKTLPITTKEFGDELARIWRPRPAPDGPKRQETIGLAISGGVDSMALAVLCSHLQKPEQPQTRPAERKKWEWNWKTKRPMRKKIKPKRTNSESKKLLENPSWPGLNFRAFVVDHDVRSGSDVEAKAVAEVLEARGIPTQVLKIEWPHFRNPKDDSNFESYARRYRFRLLGKACRDLDIDSLLLAHHEDDQAETILMRLIAGQRRMGLTGIREQSGIPENYGVYGIHESGGASLDISSENENPDHLRNRILKSMRWTSNLPQHLLSESGGIKIYRPLLGFSKAQLIATCKAEDMKWFEDYTNKDPTLTTRNAIRHMYSKYKMPRAFKKESLIEIAARIRNRNETRAARVVGFMSECDIQTFETRTGTLTIRFPDMNVLYTAKERREAEKSRVAAEMLRRILMLVTPEEHVEVSSLHVAVARLFPEIHNQESPEQNDESQTPTGFTISGVQFRLAQQDPETEQDLPTAEKQSPKKGKPYWVLSRQPLPSTSARPLITIPPKTLSDEWSDWKLFDGRYWIRIQNLTDSPISIVLFQPRYWSELRHSFGTTYRRAVEKLLRQKARGNVRWTLPLIVMPTRKYNRGKTDEAIALPTLGVGVSDVKNLVRWEVRYKKIDTTGLTIDGQISVAESGIRTKDMRPDVENPFILTIT